MAYRYLDAQGLDRDLKHLVAPRYRPAFERYREAHRYAAAKKLGAEAQEVIWAGCNEADVVDVFRRAIIKATGHSDRNLRSSLEEILDESFLSFLRQRRDLSLSVVSLGAIIVPCLTLSRLPSMIISLWHTLVIDIFLLQRSRSLS